MSDTTPSGPEPDQGEPRPPEPWAQQPEADDDTGKGADKFAELFSPPDEEQTANGQDQAVVPPWQEPLKPSDAVTDAEEMFEQRVRQAAREIEQSRQADRQAGDDADPVIPSKLAVPDTPTPQPQRPRREAPIGGIAAEPDGPPPAEPSSAKAADRGARPAAEPRQEIAPDHRLSGSYREPAVGGTERRRSSVAVEPGEPLALPQADPQYRQKVQDDLAFEEQAVVVRYGAMLQTGLFEHHLEVPPTVGAKVVVRSDRGVELGTVVVRVCSECDGPGCASWEQVIDYVATNGPKYPFKRAGKVLRAANTQDLADSRALAERSRGQIAFCRQQISDLKLDMRLVTVEGLLGDERIVFYFTSEQRVDFRDLVRRLTSQYHTRVELRQVGARDEARLVADFERCGRQCCCQSFIKDLQPVSMRMAKLQKATLDPLKISGRCSRLMCCLRYEDENYKELRKHLPKNNTWVRTASLVGKVVDAHILTQLVRIQMPDRSQTVIGTEEIVARDVEPPETEMQLNKGSSGAPGRVARGRGERRSPFRPADGGQQDDRTEQLEEPAQEAAPDESPQQARSEDGPAKRRRSRRKEPSAEKTESAEQPSSEVRAQSEQTPKARDPSAGQQEDTSKPRRRRRRRKKKS